MFRILVTIIAIVRICYIILDEKPTLQQLQVMSDHSGEELRIRDEVAAQWEDLAIALGFEGCNIKCIKRDHSQNARAACQLMLLEWLNGERNLRKPVTWGTLIQSLVDADFKSTAERIAIALQIDFSFE